MAGSVGHVIASALQYLIERGEIELLEDIEPKVRYTGTPTDTAVVRVGRKRFQLTVTEL